jgi:hypothetical protein
MPIITEDQLANPELGQLITPQRYELDEARKIAFYATIVALELQPDIARKVDSQVKEKLKARILTASLDELQRRIEAVSVQNPGLLVEAMRRAGYSIQVDGAGNVGIDVSGDSAMTAGMGRHITVEEFEAL